MKIQRSLRTRLSTIQIVTGCVALLIIAAFIKLYVAGHVLTPESVQAASCETSYELDWSDPTTYTVTCGSVNSGGWSVKGATCTYSSPVLTVGGLPGDRDRTVDIIARINQSGNLENNDTAWVFYYIQGVLSYTDRYIGGGAPGVFTSSRTLIVPAAKTFQISIKLRNDMSNELWQIKDGDINACAHIFSPLPVTLTSFTAEAESNDSVLLEWITASEVNNDYFTVEGSADGRQFTEITKVNGSGTCSTSRPYSCMVTRLTGSISYYRLKQTDYNGKTQTFKMIPVSIKQKNNLLNTCRVSPNPFYDFFTAQFESSEKEELEVQLMNKNGSFVFSEKIIAEPGNNIYRYTPPSNLKQGTYIFRILNGKAVLANTKVVYSK